MWKLDVSHGIRRIRYYQVPGIGEVLYGIMKYLGQCSHGVGDPGSCGRITIGHECEVPTSVTLTPTSILDSYLYCCILTLLASTVDF